MFWRLSTLLLIVMTPYSVFGEVKPGNYLFLHSKIVGCGEKTFFVDYAEVPAGGNVTFLEKYEVNVIGQSADEIALQLSTVIGADTGHAPKTISILVLTADEVTDIADNLDQLVLPTPKCRRPQVPTSPRRDLEPVRGLANTSPTTNGRYWPKAAHL